LKQQVDRLRHHDRQHQPNSQLNLKSRATLKYPPFQKQMLLLNQTGQALTLDAASEHFEAIVHKSMQEHYKDCIYVGGIAARLE
jgi:primosomal protein N'